MCVRERKKDGGRGGRYDGMKKEKAVDRIVGRGRERKDKKGVWNGTKGREESFVFWAVKHH